VKSQTSPKITTRLSLSPREWEAVRTAAKLLEAQQAPFGDLVLPGTGTLARLERIAPGRFALRLVSEEEVVAAMGGGAV